MKIGIITITHGQNYGNRLQNYALQEAIKSLGHDVETIWNNAGAWENLNFLSRVKCWVKRAFHIKYSPRVERIHKFNKFNMEYINWSKISVDKGKVPANLSSKYDKFICGSDQIWNPFYGRTSNIDFLTFARPEQKIAYAPSLGVSEIEKGQEEVFQKALVDFPNISVREESGAIILKKLLKRDISVVPDPTLLLKKEKWDKLQKKPREINNNKYLLTYFLGENVEAKKEAEMICQKEGLDLISLDDCFTDGYENPYYITMDPAEFLWLIAHAEKMMTDSFHGCVFSIIYGIPFVVFPRNYKVSMQSRIQQLMKMFDLEDHLALDSKHNDSILHQSYHVEAKLESIRKYGMDYLKKKLEKQ